jgi:sensor histidine kinase regulating citrate/malate metabolism
MAPILRSLRLRTQVLLLQTALVAVTLAVAFGVFAYTSGERLSDEYGQRALAVARAVASESEVRTLVAAYSAADSAGTPAAPPEHLAVGAVQRAAEEARLRTGALFVVITDDRGLRLAHPDPSLLGQMVSTDPSQALGGDEVVTRERGTLGESVRAKVPVLEPRFGPGGRRGQCRHLDRRRPDAASARPAQRGGASPAPPCCCSGWSDRSCSRAGGNA